MPLQSNPTLQVEYHAWDKGRRESQTRLAINYPEAVRQGWQCDYFHGHNPRGEPAAASVVHVKEQSLDRAHLASSVDAL